LSYLVGAVVGSVVGGYVTARVAKRNQFIHSVVVIAMLSALLWRFSRPGKDFDAFWITVELTVLASLLLLLGTWMGSRKRKQIERSA